MTGAVTVRFLRKSTRNSLIAFILIASLHSKHFFSNESSEVHWSPPSKPVNLPWNYFLTHLVLNCRPRWWENISIIVRALPHRKLGESRSRSALDEIEKLCPEGMGGGGGGSPSLSHMVCASPKGVVFGPFFGLKTGIDFAHFGVESASMVFEGTTGVYERIYRFNLKWKRYS